MLIPDPWRGSLDRSPCSASQAPSTAARRQFASFQLPSFVQTPKAKQSRNSMTVCIYIFKKHFKKACKIYSCMFIFSFISCSYPFQPSHVPPLFRLVCRLRTPKRGGALTSDPWKYLQYQLVVCKVNIATG